MQIKIGLHVINRFIQRFNPNLGAVSCEEDRNRIARKVLALIVDESQYLSDNQRGVLLYYKPLNAKLIMQNKELKTIFHNVRKTYSREKKAGL